MQSNDRKFVVQHNIKSHWGRNCGLGCQNKAMIQAEIHIFLYIFLSLTFFCFMLIEALKAWKSANRIVNVNWPLKIYSNILKLIGSFQEVFQKCFIWKYPSQTPDGCFPFNFPAALQILKIYVSQNTRGASVFSF